MTASVWTSVAETERFSLKEYASSNFSYQCLELREPVTRIYLYAFGRETPDQQAGSYILGVFDLKAQAEHFLHLHRLNHLNIPCLRVGRDQPMVQVEGDHLIDYQRYEGVYTVGLKSYRVYHPNDSDLLRIEYMDRYQVELLGETDDEVQSCLWVYSHFDARLRGCRVC